MASASIDGTEVTETHDRSRTPTLRTRFNWHSTSTGNIIVCLATTAMALIYTFSPDSSTRSYPSSKTEPIHCKSATTASFTVNIGKREDFSTERFPRKGHTNYVIDGTDQPLCSWRGLCHGNSLLWTKDGRVLRALVLPQRYWKALLCERSKNRGLEDYVLLEPRRNTQNTRSWPKRGGESSVPQDAEGKCLHEPVKSMSHIRPANYRHNRRARSPIVWYLEARTEETIFILARSSSMQFADHAPRDLVDIVILSPAVVRILGRHEAASFRFDSSLCDIHPLAASMVAGRTGS